jgi:ribosomal protein L11 methyltransferase
MPFNKHSSHRTMLAKLETDEQAAHRIADSVAERFDAQDVAVGMFDAGRGRRWQVAIHFHGRIDTDAMRDAVSQAAGTEAAKALRFARVEETDWVRQSLAGLAPVAAGRFIVHGAHDSARVPVNRIGIEIEAAHAFGTGHHGTTRGCLLALDRVCKALRKPRNALRHPEVRAPGAPRKMPAVALRGSPRSSRGSHLRVTDRRKELHVLDVGTGSGVLAVAAARALRQRVLATDIDASAVAAARANINLNRAGAMVGVIKADGVGARQIRARAPFDLIFANILLAPLQRMAAPLRRLAAPNARIILSGVLPSQANAVIASYRPLALCRRIDIDGWSTLVFARRSTHPARG